MTVSEAQVEIYRSRIDPAWGLEAGHRDGRCIVLTDYAGKVYRVRTRPQLVRILEGYLRAQREQDAEDERNTDDYQREQDWKAGQAGI